MTSRRDRLLSIVSVPLMLAAGALLAVQSQINGRLAAQLGTGPRAGVLAAVVSFGIGLAVLVPGALALPGPRRGLRAFAAAVRDHGLRPVELVGGLFGAFLVSCQGLAVGTIGVALFSVALTAGQASSSLAVDQLGIGPAGRQPVSAPRIVAATCAVLAVVLATAGRGAAGVSVTVVVLAGLSLLAGVGTALQQALNGRVSRVAGPWVTTLNNFLVGMAGLLVALLATLLAHGHLDGLPGQPWLYLGGPLGITFIWLSAQLVRVHGVLVLSLSVIAGQVVAATLIDAVSAHAQVGIAGYLASALTVAGVLVALGLRRLAQAPDPAGEPTPRP